MKNAKQRFPPDIRSRCVATAKGYYALILRRNELRQRIGFSNASGHDKQQADTERVKRVLEETERLILAVEQTWASCQNQSEQYFFKKNFLDGMSMQFIDLDKDIRTMKRWRKKLLLRLAKNLNEI